MSGGRYPSMMPSFHTRAAIISIGDEIVLGQSLDTNSKWLSDQLVRLGVTGVEHVTVGDTLDDIVASLQRLAGRVDLVVSTGGLGPTLDDLTRQALAKLLGEELVMDHAALDAIRIGLEKGGRKMSDAQKIQATRPVSARTIPNAFGTAPGLRATFKGGTGASADIYCLPGPPDELKPMFTTHVLPLLRLDPSHLVLTRFVHLAGIAESEAGVKLGDLMDRSRRPLVGITASGSILTCRVRYEGDLPREQAEAEVEATCRAIRARLGEYVFAEGDETFGAMLVREMQSRTRTVAVVESCTGGLMGASLTDTPNASVMFVGGFLTYTNELKEKLVGVSAADLRDHGAVSEPVARAMALGGLERTGATDCLAITGVAGPDGGTPEKPVGTVYIAHAWRHGDDAPRTDVRRFHFPGTRDDVRRRSVMAALQMLRLGFVREDPRERKLLWEMASA